MAMLCPGVFKHQIIMSAEPECHDVDPEDELPEEDRTVFQYYEEDHLDHEFRDSNDWWEPDGETCANDPADHEPES